MQNITPEQLYKTIGQNVAKYRKEKGLSQLALALAIGHKAVGTISMSEICINNKKFNIEHLLKINIDYLKIDASLIKNIAINENSYKITKTIIEFAKNLNLKTIAEYVENEEIFNIVKDLGADYSQGYFFSTPISAPTVLEYNKEMGNNNE